MSPPNSYSVFSLYIQCMFSSSQPETKKKKIHKLKIMSSKIASSPNPILNLCPKPNHSSISSVSFTSKSFRIPTRTGPCRTRSRARIDAVYAPAETRVTETLYELLGITETESSFSDIKKAYKQMARKYHPDVSPPDRVDEYTRRFIMVHQAYETLSDPQTRASYDRDLAGGFGFSFSARQQETEEKGKWRRRWQSQMDELKQRESRGKMSWGARMRTQR